MLFRNRNQCYLWLTGVLVCTTGGWFFGATLKAPRSTKITQNNLPRSSTHPRTIQEKDFAAGSPQRLWIDRIKAAKAGDFPKLLAEWEELFPSDDRYDDCAPEAKAALRWAYGRWLMTDPDGFIQAVIKNELYSHEHAAEAMVELMPQAAVDLLSQTGAQKPDPYFLASIAKALAEQHPLLYLQWNPKATIEMADHRSTSKDWITAIKALSKTNAFAAGRACLRWEEYDDSRGIYEALKAVVTCWKTSDPPIADWVNGIADTTMRNLAKHAWLSTMAEHDPHAALKAFRTAKLYHEFDLDESASSAIVTHLARKDPQAALKLLKESEEFFEKLIAESDDPSGESNDLSDPFGESNVTRDPFAESPAEEEPTVEEPAEPPVPFSDLLVNTFDGDSAMKSYILAALAEKLPRDPEGLITGIRALTAGVAADAAWKRNIEAEMISQACQHWSVQDCVKTSAIWSTDSPTKEDHDVLEKLVTHAASDDPESALAQMSQFPEQIRSTLLNQAILQIPATETNRRTELLRQLPAEQWDASIGNSLGYQAHEYASLVAEMNLHQTNDALGGFTDRWGRTHPEAAAAWLTTLQNPDAATKATASLAESWLSYDPDAASAWVDSLPHGTVRDTASKTRENFFSK